MLEHVGEPLGREVGRAEKLDELLALRNAQRAELDRPPRSAKLGLLELGAGRA